MLTAEEMESYSTGASQRSKEERQELVRREVSAWEVARRAAMVLKTQFGANKVVVFGSLVHKGCFTRWSDVDIAAWGISPDETFRAINAVLGLDAHIEVNLVDVDACRPSLLTVIELEGVEL